MARRFWIGVIIVTLTGSVLVPETEAQTIWYVNGALATNGDGHLWSSAFNNLQSAISAAGINHLPHDQIWVAKAIYKPSMRTIPEDPRSVCFSMPSGIDVYGGFIGNETSLGSRRPDLNVTVLSGDIGTLGLAADNAYCVALFDGSAVSPTLDGLTVTGGCGVWNIWGSGAGILITGGATPVLENLRIVDNQASDWGGGMYIDSGTPTLTACTFERNRAKWGGGLCVYSSASTLYLDRCVFDGNIADVQAGALFNRFAGTLEVRNTIFRSNLCLSGESLDQRGGAIVNLYYCTARYVNCLYDGNMNLAGGGAMWNDGGASISLINCTIVSNSSVCGSGGGLYTQANTTATNCIFWNNRDVNDPSGTGQAAQIYQDGGTLSINYCDVRGWTGGGTGNINDDPNFVAPAARNLRLQGSSPCVDAGSNGGVSEPNDLDGYTRIVPSNGYVDMGAYELQALLADDCDGNTIHDGNDLAACSGQAWCSDCNANGIPDVCDILIAEGGHCDAGVRAD